VFFLLGIVLLIFVPWPWNLVSATACLVLFCGELWFWSNRMRGRHKVVGAQTLVGQEAEVLAPCRPTGQVRIGGEIWEARCEAGAGTGERVRVTGREHLTLVVEPVSG
jgi:membrane protein implicated in regulation of membrane protease activity